MGLTKVRPDLFLMPIYPIALKRTGANGTVIPQNIAGEGVRVDYNLVTLALFSRSHMHF